MLCDAHNRIKKIFDPQHGLNVQCFWLQVPSLAMVLAHFGIRTNAGKDQSCRAELAISVGAACLISRPQHQQQKLEIAAVACDHETYKSVGRKVTHCLLAGGAHAVASPGWAPDETLQG